MIKIKFMLKVFKKRTNSETLFCSDLKTCPWSIKPLYMSWHSGEKLVCYNQIFLIQFGFLTADTYSISMYLVVKMRKLTNLCVFKVIGCFYHCILRFIYYFSLFSIAYMTLKVFLTVSYVLYCILNG